MEFRQVIIECEMSMAGELSPLLSSSFSSIGRLFPPFSTSFLFVHHPSYPRKWICFLRTKRFVLLFRPRPSEWNDRYYYAAADPCKQWRREKYPYTVNRMKNIWPGFSSVCYLSYKLIECAGETPELDMHAACRRNDASSRREVFFVQKLMKLWYTFLMQVK